MVVWAALTISRAGETPRQQPRQGERRSCSVVRLSQRPSTASHPRPRPPACPSQHRTAAPSPATPSDRHQPTTTSGPSGRFRRPPALSALPRIRITSRSSPRPLAPPPLPLSRPLARPGQDAMFSEENVQRELHGSGGGSPLELNGEPVPAPGAQRLALPAPGRSSSSSTPTHGTEDGAPPTPADDAPRTLEVGGESVKIDKLGPLIVNTDGVRLLRPRPGARCFPHTERVQPADAYPPPRPDALAHHQLARAHAERAGAHGPARRQEAQQVRPSAPRARARVCAHPRRFASDPWLISSLLLPRRFGRRRRRN